MFNPNLEEKLKLPENWYDTEDDMYNEIYSENVELMDMFDQIQSYSHELLNNSPCALKARNFLKEKRIPEVLWEKFGLGYLPDFNEWISSLGYGNKQKEMLKKSGIMRDTRAKDMVSWFSARIVFPIRNRQGHCVKFWGRIIDRTMSMYSPIYASSRQIGNYNTIYGLYEGLEEIQKKKVMILCEGPMDILALHSVGLGNACSLLLCPITDSQIELIRESCDKVIIMPDCDDYGLKQSETILETLKKSGIDGILLRLKDARDPLAMYLKNPSTLISLF